MSLSISDFLILLFLPVLDLAEKSIPKKEMRIDFENQDDSSKLDLFLLLFIPVFIFLSLVKLIAGKRE